MADAFKASPQIVGDYLRLFVNRRAYTMQSMGPHPESGRYYYFRPGIKQNGTPPALTKETIRRHLEGEITIGLYAINPYTQRCKWVAIDADYKNALEDLLKLQYHLSLDKVEPALEMSRRGGHLWIFLATPLLAKECRIYIHDLAARLGLPVKGWGLADGIEVFPRHNAIGDGRFGNAIRGPLGIHRVADRRFWFSGADHTLQAQLAYLNGLRKVTEDELREFIAGKEVTQDELHQQREPQFKTGRRMLSSEFHILEHIGKVRRVGRNYVGRCPSCAGSGHDRAADNLAILIEDPRFYRCWAGCTKQMIRAAVGHPIRVPQRNRTKSTVKRNRLTGATAVRLPPVAAGIKGAGNLSAVPRRSPMSTPGQPLRSARHRVRWRRWRHRPHVTLRKKTGTPIECLQPVEAIGVTCGRRGASVSPSGHVAREMHTRVVHHRGMLRAKSDNGSRPNLETRVLYRGVHGTGFAPGKTRRKVLQGCRSTIHYQARCWLYRNS